MVSIEVRGAREHNLRGVDLTVAVGSLTVFCGVSGSGKSSMAFDVIHAEGQRRYLEATAAGGRVRLPSPPRVDAVTGLPPSLALAQRTGTLPRTATVGSLSETERILRVLFGRAGVQHCPRCGREIRPVSIDEMSARLLRLPEGTRLLLETPLRAGDDAVLEEVGRAGFGRIRVDDEILRLEDVDGKRLLAAKTVRVVVDRIRIEAERAGRVHDSLRLALRAGRGVVVAVHDGGIDTFVERPYCLHDDLPLPALEPELFDPFGATGTCRACAGAGEAAGAPCAACAGSGLGEAARAVRWRGRGFLDLAHDTVSGARAALEAVADRGTVERPTLEEAVRRLRRLEGLSLGHLRLSRPGHTLSTSEVRRLRLARTVASPLAGVLYVLDEPAAGLDESVASQVAALMRELVEAGNTVIAVEHHAAVLRAADALVEFGPGAGQEGGRVVARGDRGVLEGLGTPTGRFLSGHTRPTPSDAPPASTSAVLAGSWCHGADRPTLTLPRGRVVVVTGPSGSGKSAFVGAVQAALGEGPPPGVSLSGAEGLTRLVAADRAAGKGSRSSVATWMGLWDVLRDLLAQTRDAQVRALTASSFSLNTTGGRCEACKGTGEQWIELGPLPEVVETCPVCLGRRFQLDVLEVRWKGHNAAELLALESREALPRLAGHPKLEGPLRALVRAGLGYVPLGQSIGSLSGGEARRLVIARELGRAARRGGDDVLVLLDDPTVGLHPDDVLALLELFRELRTEGSTVWCTTADPLLVAGADAVVTLPATG